MARVASPEALVNNESEDVSQDEAEGLLTAVQGVSKSFHGFTDSEIVVLAQAMNVQRFREGQTILEQGELGSWFGIVLSGQLSVVLPDGSTITIQEGAIVGEMALWQRHAARSATVCGRDTGVIAAMVVSDMNTLVIQHPVVNSRDLSPRPRSRTFRERHPEIYDMHTHKRLDVTAHAHRWASSYYD